MKPNIAIIGEYHDGFEPHCALNRSLDELGAGSDFTYQWIDTATVAADGDRCLKGCAGVWSAPGSPFKSLDGARELLLQLRHQSPVPKSSGAFPDYRVRCGSGR
jgi:CTP synthase (UTP-ammonia lyase)